MEGSSASHPNVQVQHRPSTECWKHNCRQTGSKVKPLKTDTGTQRHHQKRLPAEVQNQVQSDNLSPGVILLAVEHKGTQRYANESKHARAHTHTSTHTNTSELTQAPTSTYTCTYVPVVCTVYSNLQIIVNTTTNDCQTLHDIGVALNGCSRTSIRCQVDLLSLNNLSNDFLSKSEFLD